MRNGDILSGVVRYTPEMARSNPDVVRRGLRILIDKMSDEDILAARRIEVIAMPYEEPPK